MPVTGLDSSVLVAALQSLHERHEPALKALDRVLSFEEQPVLPRRALTEAYSVLTRLPAPHRVAPKQALELLRGTLEGNARIIDLPLADTWPHLERLAQEATVGGAVYDAEILECCIQSGATQILTLNGRDFRRLAPPEIKVVVPGETSHASP